MADVNQFKFKIVMPGQENKPPVVRPLTQKQALAYIESQEYAPQIKAALIKRISRFPANTLNMAIKNIPRFINEINQQINQEKE